MSRTMIPIYVLTNDLGLWLLRGFTHQWAKYGCGRDFTVVGYSEPDCDVNFLSLGNQVPKDMWSDSLIDFITGLNEWFILMLEDYWLTAPADWTSVESLRQYYYDDVLRIDISGERSSYKHVKFCPGMVQSAPEARYLMSYQAGIWNRDNMLKVLRRGEDPWQSEIEGTKRVNPLRVLGTEDRLVKYQPVWRSKQNRWMTDKFLKADVEDLKANGCFVK